MIQPSCPLGFYAALLPVAALVVSGAPAHSQQVPVVAPSHEQLAPATGAPTAQIGVAVRRLGGQPLDHDFPALQGRELRLRELTIAPGGSITLHRHDQRPGVAYILEGQMTEWRGPGFTPRVIGPGEAVFEATGVSHWWRNQGTTPARALVVDIVPVSTP
ncbi:cupin domain-containing protein [Synechococcus sp. CBW1006]|jgi:quercetin dioxygenase-like cupin family protein|uniref:cupin domain-containing protein n=1 Tax=Synechococcus sp. CBW1006 TaxID=1353138 RepID=UPI0018CCF88C|nr:cupin domain-containing protein [Synechococcus sp. CBW1006]QPN67290.1 cupin domain-containing protein [Synechococcus sp. CBW1006]